jgi:hypothetical protein
LASQASAPSESGIFARKKTMDLNRTAGHVVVPLAAALAVLAGACGRDALMENSAMTGGARPASASGGVIGAGPTGGAGGASGAGGTVVLRLPDGGIGALIGDSGILGGILDAPRDSLIGQVLCGPEARIGAPCSSVGPGCLLPSLGGACACLGGTYVCPLNPSQGPTACPAGAASGKSCFSPLSVCIGGAANACICGVGTYTCF